MKDIKVMSVSLFSTSMQFISHSAEYEQCLFQTGDFSDRQRDICHDVLSGLRPDDVLILTAASVLSMKDLEGTALREECQRLCQVYGPLWLDAYYTGQRDEPAYMARILPELSCTLEGLADYLQVEAMKHVNQGGIHDFLSISYIQVKAQGWIADALWEAMPKRVPLYENEVMTGDEESNILPFPPVH